MIHKKIKMVALLSMTLITVPLFAEKIDKDLIGAPQPYITDSNLSAVQISFSTLSNFNPTSINGPTTYKGQPIIRMCATNNTSASVNIQCLGTISTRICRGDSITTCAYTITPPFITIDAGKLAIQNLGANNTANTALILTSPITTDLSGWSLEVFNDVPLSCTITNSSTGASIIKEYFIPVA